MATTNGHFPVTVFSSQLSIFPFFDCTLISHSYQTREMLLDTSFIEPATDANVSGIVEPRIPAYSHATEPPILTSTSCHNKTQISLRFVAGGGNQTDHREAAAANQQFKAGKPDVRNAPIPSELYAFWARYSQLHITWNPQKNRTTAREHSLDKRNDRIDIKWVVVVETVVFGATLL